MILANRPLGQELVGLLLHSLMAGIVASVAAFFTSGLVGLLFHVIGLPLPFSNLDWLLNPLIWLPAAFVGFVANGEMRHRSACLVGIMGAILFFLIMRSEVSLYERSPYYQNLTHGHYWRYAYREFFSSDCRGSECMGQVFFTLPFLSSVAYSVGAWLALRRERAKDEAGTL